MLWHTLGFLNAVSDMHIFLGAAARLHTLYTVDL